ncbi:MAG: polysaccharide deacetylase family protein [Bacilli bacterium]|nr:polysaccharide deacetylase family protein [Bacilli bacterium]
MKRKILKYLMTIIITILILNINDNIKIISKKNVVNYDCSDKIEIKNGFLYEYNNNQYIKIGNLNNIQLSLEKNHKKGYYQIKNSNFYIYYKDASDIVNIEESKLPYIEFNEKIITKNKFNLYLDDNKIISINKSMKFSYVMKDDSYYYINYLNNIYKIKKNDILKYENDENNINKYTNNIPVLNFVKQNNNNCYNECISELKINEILTYLKDNKYNTISLEDYYKWLNNNIALPNNTVLILSDDINYDNLIINKKDNNFIYNNKASKITDELKNISSYKINNNINISNLKDILNNIDIIDKNIDDSLFATSIPILNYHFFYDEEKGEQAVCNENICEEIKEFEKHLAYLNENGFKTLTINEFIDWMYNKIELPEKSVLITIDDGAFGTDTHLPRLLNKYQINATLFLITAWWPKEKYISPYLEIESHGYDIHKNGNCGKAKILCLSKQEIINDLNKSIEILNTNKAFCYPFYQHSNSTKEAIIESGFKIAFVGGSRNATRSDDKFEIPRYPIFSSTNFESFINIIN